MREGLAAVAIVHEHIDIGTLGIGGIDRTYGTTCGSKRSIRCLHGCRHGLQLLAVLEVHIQSGRYRQVHHVCIVERSPLGQRVRAVAARWVAQHVVEDGLALGHDVAAAADGEHVEHEAPQWLGLYEGAVALYGEGHRAQGVLALQQRGKLVGLQREAGLT